MSTPGSPALRPLRGEIWEIALDPRKGREQQGTRPCLVVSTNAMNRSNFGTIIVCPITTTERPNFKWRPALDPSDLGVADATWQARPSWVETDQIVTVDTAARAIRHLASLDAPGKMAVVDASLKRMFGF